MLSAFIDVRLIRRLARIVYRILHFDLVSARWLYSASLTDTIACAFVVCGSVEASLRVRIPAPVLVPRSVVAAEP